MPAPAQITYNATTLKSHLNQAVADAIDAGASAGKINFYTEADTLLATALLADPCGNVTAGQLVLSAGATALVLVSGTCTWATLTDSDDNVVISLPVTESGSAVDGQLALNATNLVQGGVLSLTSFTVG